MSSYPHLSERPRLPAPSSLFTRPESSRSPQADQRFQQAHTSASFDQPGFNSQERSLYYARASPPLAASSARSSWSPRHGTRPAPPGSHFSRSDSVMPGQTSAHFHSSHSAAISGSSSQPLWEHRYAEPPWSPYAPGPVYHMPQAAPVEMQRKRLRNTRSCAECQRRKTKCDVVGAFPDEIGKSGAVSIVSRDEEDKVVVQPCTPCVRGGNACQYSRKPAKRGPAKGTTKDPSIGGRAGGSPDTTLRSGSDADDQAGSSFRDGRMSGPGSFSGTASPESEDTRKLRPWELSSRPWEIPSIPIASSAGDLRPLKRAKSEAEAPVVSKFSRAPAALQEAASGDAVLARSRSGSPLFEVTSNRPGLLASANARSASPALSATTARKNFAASDINGTFAIVPSDGKASSHAPIGLDERVTVRAMRLLLEPAAETPAIPTSGATAVSWSSSPSTKSSNFANRPHSFRLAHLQGQAMAGLKYDKAEGALPHACSILTAVRAAHQLAKAHAAIESDALVLCYLDSVRLGSPDNSALAAAASKLSIFDASEASDLLRRRVILFAIDRFHSIAFHDAPVMAQQQFPGDCNYLQMLPALGDISANPLGRVPAEVLRVALMLGSLCEAAANNGGWKNVSLADCNSIINSNGAQHDMDSSEESSDSHTSSTASKDVRTAKSTTIWSLQAFRYAMRGTFFLYHRLQTLPTAKHLTVSGLTDMLEVWEECILVGGSKTPPDPSTVLMRSFIGPFVFALAAASMSWMARALAYLCKLEEQNELTSSTSAHESEEHVRALRYLKLRLFDYSRMLGPLCLYSAGTGDEVRPLYLRIAAFNTTTISYLARFLGDADEIPETATPYPGLDALPVLEVEVDDRASLTQEMGAMGIILASTTNREAWDLLVTGLA